MPILLAATAGAASVAAAQSPAKAPAAASCTSTPVRPAVAAAPLRLFAYDRSQALDVRDSVEGVQRGVTVKRVSFASPKGGRATGMLLVPHDSLRGARGRFAGVVSMHGAPGDARGMMGLALPLASRGAVVLVLDAPWARRDPRNPLTFTARDSADQVQLVVDLQRAVDVLAARADVDADRLGYFGVSYGGAMGALFAGVERRLKAYALLVGDGGLAAHFTRADGRRMDPPGPVPPAQWCGWFQAMEPLASTRFVGRATGARLLFLWGTRDELVPPYLAEQLWQAAPAGVKEARWYDSGHRLPEAAHLDMADWLASRIGTRAVSAAERAAFPAATPVRRQGATAGTG